MDVEILNDLNLRSGFNTLEHAYVEEYLASQGCSLALLHDLPVEKVKELMRAASLYASMKLSEVENRAQLVDELHGGHPPA